LNVKKLRNHLNNDCPEIQRDSFISDQKWQELFLKDMGEMLRKHVSGAACDTFKSLGKIKFPAASLDNFHLCVEWIEWTSLNGSIVQGEIDSKRRFNGKIAIIAAGKGIEIGHMKDG